MSTITPAATKNTSAVLSKIKVSPPVILILLALATRFPLVGHRLYHWDSVNFAFAIQRFDVAAGQPQAPGYLFYVLMGRAAAALMGSAQAGYVLLAVLGTALSAWAIYDLGKRLWNERAGWYAALLMLSSPLYWFYGEVALPHALDALMVIVAADLSWRVWRGETRIAPILALWLGLAGGLREQTLVFLLPVALVACARLPWRVFAVSAGILVAVTLSWLIPLLHSSGGWHAYWAMIGGYSQSFDTPTSVFLGAGWHGLHHNLSKLFRYTLWGWACGLVPLALAWTTLRRTRAVPWTRNVRIGLLALWAAPSLFFYVFIHMGQQGLIFVYLPICFLLSGRAAEALGGQGRKTAIMALCVAANAALYLFTPAYPLPGQPVKVLSEAAVRDRDRQIDGALASVRADMPAGAVLLADDWRYPEYYLPHVSLVAMSALVDDGDGDDATTVAGAPPMPSLAHASALAWYEPGLDSCNRSPKQTVLMPPHDGTRLRVLRRQPGQHFWVSGGLFGLAPEAPPPR